MLQVEATQGDITEAEVDAIVVNLFEDIEDPGGATGAVDAALDGAITDVIEAGDLEGKAGKAHLLYTNGALPARRVVVVGLGEADELDGDAIRRAGGATVKALKGTEVHTVASIVHGAGAGGLDTAHAARCYIEGVRSRAYRFERKSEQGEDEDEDERAEITELVMLERDGRRVSAVERGVEQGAIVADAQAFARDVASFSGEEAAPEAIARTVRTAAENTGLDCEVYDKSRIEDEEMGGVLAVSRGSHREPRFVRLEWDPPGARRTVCLVGKGVTFDTGGISIKRSSGMDKMRYDKGGAAAVFGTLLAAEELDLPVHLIGLCPLVENMPGGNAIKPGDVIKMRSGKTVDVLNTDAEGRLIMADALDVAKEIDPDHTLDLATLTGAVSTALGTQAAAVMGDDQRLIDQLVEAGEVSRERVWQLPFYDEYDEQLDGIVGDVKNVGGRPAGCITAGKFLSNFAPEESWAHLDIAGVAWNETKPYFNGDYTPKGATGAGVRLLTTWLETL